MQYTISSPPKPKVTIRTPTQGKRIKILTPKQMLQRLPEALAQVKAGNTSDYLLKKRQTVYSLYRAKDYQITKNVYNQIYVDIIKWKLYSRIQKIVKLLIHICYYLILPTNKKTYEEMKKVLHYIVVLFMEQY